MYRICCTCHFGLESVLKFEVNKIGGKDLEVRDGRVTFSGDKNMIARANICLATAERVMIELGRFRALSFEELFQGVKALPLEEFISVKEKFPVKGHSLDSKLSSVPACQSIIKKAAVERLKACYHVNFFEETESEVAIRFSILRDEVSVCLDTSGVGLHKRGYRANSNAAPIKETLAAGIVDLARVRKDTVVCDPFCGSGTFLIEAAYKALNIAPGLKRRFAFEKWALSDEGIWKEERQRAREVIDRSSKFMGYGFDIDPECAYLSAQNAKKAGVEARIRTKDRDIADFDYPTEEPCIIICNPPYGERLLDVENARKLYKAMGRRLRPSKEKPLYVISADEDFEKYFGARADKKRKLYNGMMKCDLYSYFK